MALITVYTKQHAAVLETLERHGVHRAQRGPVLQNEDSLLMRGGYDWLAEHLPQENRHPSADYPVWVSFSRDAAMLPGPGYVILELQVEESLLMRVNIAKWGAINNCSYLPLDASDERRHRREMEELGLSDVKACTSRFYPQQRKKIEDSWIRLFDDRVQLGNDLAYGLLWEVRKEWIQSVTR